MLKLACSIALTLVAGVAYLTTSPAGATRARCPGEFVVANRYWKITAEDGPLDPLLYACDQRRSDRRPVVLSGADITYPPAAVRGRLVAFADEFYDGAGGSRIRVVQPGNPRDTYEQFRINAYGNVTDIVLQERRRVAWINCRSKLPSELVDDEPLCSGAVIKRVFVHDASVDDGKARTNQVREVGASRRIRSKSLILRDGVISWREGNRTRRYRLR